MNVIQSFFLPLLIVMGMENVYSETQERTIKSDSFEASKKNDKNFLKFVGSSTKIGLLTTEFEGHAKDYTWTYERNGTEMKNVILKLNVSQLDTDSNKRNDKMLHQCLEVDKFPNLVAKLSGPILLKEGSSQEVPIQFFIKDKTLERKLKYTVIKYSEKGETEISFSTDFSFVEAGIKDPSIWVAKVSEMFSIMGKWTL